MSGNERHKEDQSRWLVPVSSDKGSFELDRPPSCPKNGLIGKDPDAGQD